jgi:hypothetical protein
MKRIGIALATVSFVLVACGGSASVETPSVSTPSFSVEAQYVNDINTALTDFNNATALLDLRAKEYNEYPASLGHDDFKAKVLQQVIILEDTAARLEKLKQAPKGYEQIGELMGNASTEIMAGCKQIRDSFEESKKVVYGITLWGPGLFNHVGTYFEEAGLLLNQMSHS